MAAAVAIVAGASATAATDADEANSATDYAVLVRAELFTDDLAEAQLVHDAVAAGGEEVARQAGDFYHLAAISTSSLGNSEGSFLGVDRWDSPDNIEAVYSDPAFAEGFAMLFGSEPTIELFQRQPDWYSWGEMPDTASADERWVAVVRGQLAETDPIAAQAAHDAVASGGQEESMAAGDISHVVFTGVSDPTEFLAFDVWESDQNIEAVYGDPDFTAAFLPLFASPPTVVVYRSTDWHQW
jgi:quinol monooxygenase YgiN